MAVPVSKWDVILRKFYQQGGCAAPSLHAIISWVGADSETLMLSDPMLREQFVGWLCKSSEEMPKEQRLPRGIASEIHQSREFKQELQRLVIDQQFSPVELDGIYTSIKAQMTDKETPLSQKIKALEWISTQQGWSRPKKLHIEQETTIRGGLVISAGPIMGVPSDTEVIDVDYHEEKEKSPPQKALPDSTGGYSAPNFQSPQADPQFIPRAGDHLSDRTVE